jgi:hypothetical protein
LVRALTTPREKTSDHSTLPHTYDHRLPLRKPLRLYNQPNVPDHFFRVSI